MWFLSIRRLSEVFIQYFDDQLSESIITILKRLVLVYILSDWQLSISWFQWYSHLESLFLLCILSAFISKIRAYLQTYGKFLLPESLKRIKNLYTCGVILVIVFLLVKLASNELTYPDLFSEYFWHKKSVINACYRYAIIDLSRYHIPFINFERLIHKLIKKNLIYTIQN